MGYNKHQTFYLRVNWLSKVINSFENLDNDFFIRVDENYKDFGIGKVMFKSLKYWLEATCIFSLEKNTNTDRSVKNIHKPTFFTCFLINNDKHTKLNITKLLLHYFLVSDDKINNVEIDHVFYWFFNVNNDFIFDKNLLVTKVLEWDKRATIKQVTSDVDNLLLTYTKLNPSSPEDLVVSYLSTLKLIKLQNGLYYKIPLDKNNYDLDAFFFILLRWKERKGNLTLESLCNDENSLGRIFNLNKMHIIEIIENMISKSYPLEIDKTNNLNTIKLNYTESSESFLLNLEKGEK